MEFAKPTKEFHNIQSINLLGDWHNLDDATLDEEYGPTGTTGCKLHPSKSMSMP